MDKYKQFPIFSMFDDPNEIVETLKLLDNGELLQMTRWMGHRVSEDRGSLSAVEKEHNRAQEIADLLDKEYGKSVWNTSWTYEADNKSDKK